MASVIETKEGTGEHDELIKWINDNNLKKAKKKLLDYEISLQELAQLSNQSVQQLQEFGQSELNLNLNLIMALRFANAIKALGAPSKHEYKQSDNTNLPMSEYAVKCEGLCGMKHNPDQLYICYCDKKVLCAECGNLSHRKKKHQFISDNIKSIETILKADETKYNSGSQIGAAFIEYQERIKKIIWNQKWHAVESTASLVLSFGTTIAVTMTDYAIKEAVCKGAECVRSIAQNARYGAAFAVALEMAYIGYQYQGGTISGQEAIALGATAVFAAGTSTACLFKLSDYTDKLIELGKISPYTAIGVSFIGAIIIGMCVRGTVDFCWQKWFGNDKEQDERTVMQKEALKYFFGDENYNIDDDKKFNEKILKRRYHRFAIINHPDTKNGNEEEWLKLCMCYGILTRICEYKLKDKNGDNLSESKDHKLKPLNTHSE